ncbi:MAG: SCP2 sterol-binding domain-containing protein [Ruminococcus sp.]|nr:SCP2 sterol-binding domain-containing protein [Ruminococcus sp.]
MTYEEIFEAAKTEFMKSDVSSFKQHLAVQIDIIGEGEGAFYVELKDGQLYVEPYEYYDRHVKLIATAKDFLKIVNGSLNAVMAYTTGKLRIEGDLGKALELQQIIENIKKTEKKEQKAAKKKK